MAIEMTPDAIKRRWDNMQIRDAGGWVKVPGQPDPRQDVRALLQLAGVDVTDAGAKPKKAKKASSRKGRAKAAAVATGEDKRRPADKE